MKLTEPGRKALDKLVSEALAIEAEEAKAAGAVGYMARALTLATMPHRKVDGNEFSRTNGAFTLSILSPSAIGLPYGSLPRLLVSWLTTEAVRTKERELVLGDSMSDFMRQLGLVPTGGRWGSITRLRDQSERLFASSITAIYTDDHARAIKGFRVASDAMLWWNPKTPDQTGLWRSTVTLTREFFDEVTMRPVPVDMRALKALKQSPMQLDIYVWLTYRLSYLCRSIVIPWEALQLQFGADYGRARDFKAAFLEHLKSVVTVFQEARVLPMDEGLKLMPSPTHVAKIAKP